MRLYVDDLRDAPEGWAIARSLSAAKDLLLMGEITEVSLDHDMGACPSCRAQFWSGLNDCGHVEDGADLARWMRANACLPSIVHIHTRNPVGRQAIEEALR